VKSFHVSCKVGIFYISGAARAGCLKAQPTQVLGRGRLVLFQRVVRRGARIGSERALRHLGSTITYTAGLWSLAATPRRPGHTSTTYVGSLGVKLFFGYSGCVSSHILSHDRAMVKAFSLAMSVSRGRQFVINAAGSSRYANKLRIFHKKVLRTYRGGNVSYN